MKTTAELALITLLCALCTPPVTAATNDLTSLLQQGLFEEEANHDLGSAISNYQSVAAQFDQNRQLAATAVFRLGECYRKLGRTNDAVAQYERVIQEFGDQRPLVTLSRQNIAGLGGDSPTSTSAASRGSPTLDNLESQYALLKAQLEQARRETNNEIVAELFSDNPVLASGLRNAAVAVPSREKQDMIEAARRQIFDYQELRLKILQSAIQEARAAQSAAAAAGSGGGAAPGSSEEEQELHRIQAMVQNSPDLINAPGGEDRATPLIRAARKDELRVARFLLDHGADVNRQDGWGATALFAAAETGHKSMVELLLSYGADINARRSYPNTVGRQLPLTALDCAVSRGYQAVVETLLAHQADPNIAGNDGQTPLHRAAKNADAGIAELLLQHGADANAKDKFDQTSLHLAAESGSREIVALLLAHSADVNARNKSGWTPLHSAAYAKQAAVVKLLLENGAEVNARDASGETPLLLAASAKAADVVNVLLDAKADPNLVTTAADSHPGWGPLHYAVASGNAAMAEALLQHGANPDALTGQHSGKAEWGDGRSPLDLALAVNAPSFSEKHPELVTLLLQHHANPNLENAYGVRPLMLAIDSCKNAAITKALLEAGADVNQPVDNTGWLPLQVAVWDGNRAVVETVLAFHPNVNAQGRYGATALDDAKKRPDSSEIAALLRAHGALDNLPHWDRIDVSRPSANFSTTVFRKGTNDWNRFTLLEMLLNFYDSGWLFVTPQGTSVAGRTALPFPDLSQVCIVRPHRGATNVTRLKVNLLNPTNGIDCSKDVMLEFGDTVEIPERDHALGGGLVGLTSDQAETLRNHFRITVQLKVRDQSVELHPLIYYSRIGPALAAPEARNVLLSSSDLSRVQVIRRDPQTGKTREWVLDCRPPQPPDVQPVSRRMALPPVGSSINEAVSGPDLWLRDGDVIIVPERRGS
jgi:ankyrin repeat protein